MAKSKKVSYRVIRNERVGIGSFDAYLTVGQTLPDKTPDDVIEALLAGQIIEEVDGGSELDPFSQEARDAADPEAEHAEFVQTVADEAAEKVSEHGPSDEDVQVDVTEKATDA